MDILRDEESGGNLKRPGLKAVRDRLKEAQVLVVERLDRLTRLDPSDFHMLMKELSDAGVDFASVQESFDTTTGVGKLIRNILADLSSFQKGEIAARARAGMAKKKQRLKRYSHLVPFGFTATKKGDLIANPDEMKWVKKMFLWRSRGRTFSKIAVRLNRRGVTGRLGKRWYPASVKFVLDNEIYETVLTRKPGRPRRNEVKPMKQQ